MTWYSIDEWPLAVRVCQAYIIVASTCILWENNIIKLEISLETSYQSVHVQQLTVYNITMIYLQPNCVLFGTIDLHYDRAITSSFCLHTSLPLLPITSNWRSPYVLAMSVPYNLIACTAKVHWNSTLYRMQYTATSVHVYSYL